MSRTESPLEDIITTRLFAASPEQVFAAFQDPAVLARWWGPNGFTNTLERYEFRMGGAWHITMRGPDGAVYPNESHFVEIVAPERIVFEHLRPGHFYRMIITFAPEAGGTRLTWRMRFEPDEEHRKVQAFVTVANEQNFDRLAACLEGKA